VLAATCSTGLVLAACLAFSVCVVADRPPFEASLERLLVAAPAPQPANSSAIGASSGDTRRAAGTPGSFCASHKLELSVR
jgi:hypothetical protein